MSCPTRSTARWKAKLTLPRPRSSPRKSRDSSPIEAAGAKPSTTPATEAAAGNELFVGGVQLALAELGLIDEYEFVVQPRLAGHVGAAKLLQNSVQEPYQNRAIGYLL